VIQVKLLYVNEGKEWSRLESGDEVDVVPYESLSARDQGYFRSILKTERKRNFNARLFAFNCDGKVRMGVIGRDGIPKERKK
jgi:hypothetical protein